MQKSLYQEKNRTVYTVRSYNRDTYDSSITFSDDTGKYTVGDVVIIIKKTIVIGIIKISKHIMDRITGIIIDDIIYKPVLDKTEYTCEEKCHLREFCEDSEDNTFSLFLCCSYRRKSPF